MRQGLGPILNQEKPGLTRELCHARETRGMPVGVLEKDGAGALADGCRRAIDVEIERGRIDVHEDRLQTHPEY